MAKKGQKFRAYPEEFKVKAVLEYVNSSEIYQAVSDKLSMLHSSQLKVWVKKWKISESFNERGTGGSKPLCFILKDKINS
ncbi:transposase [Peribacillus frigoritolerans]|uniref:transposase n=1 Tax=Peribacillus frigoritolerans TaxID=450367 RepID=UPI00105A62B0|nr:transposase [Peribacillus frigoritolerans]TDL82853.1 transposase [Peribacillus frigoritolerans]